MGALWYEILEGEGVAQGGRCGTRDILMQYKHTHNNGCSPAKEGRGRGGHFASHGCRGEASSAGERSVEQRPHNGGVRLLEKVSHISTKGVAILFQEACCFIGNLAGRN